MIVDRMLPELDGLTIIRTLRASHNLTPALILSALGDVDDRVDGLRARRRRLPGQTLTWGLGLTAALALFGGWLMSAGVVRAAGLGQYRPRSAYAADPLAS